MMVGQPVKPCDLRLAALAMPWFEVRSLRRRADDPAVEPALAGAH
jgi:hypothetical protein